MTCTEKPMRALTLIPVLALALAGCVPPPEQSAPAQGSGQTTPVTWKTNTPAAQRAQDILSCEYEARGLSPTASPDEFAAASGTIGIDRIDAFVTNCVTQKGYVKTVMPVCSNAQIVQGQFVQAPAEFLPPLSDVRCMVVGQGFVV